MEAAASDSSKQPIRIEGDFDFSGLFLVAAKVEEGFNYVTSATIEFATRDRTLDLNNFVGKQMKIVMDVAGRSQRVFPGLCISAEFLGTSEGAALYRAEFRSWFWFMKKNMNNKVYQEKDVLEIFDQVMGDIGYNGEVKKRVSGTYPKRVYTVQYRETDFDFINRLFEEEGIYYFFAEKDGKEELVLADGDHAHDDIIDDKMIVFRDYSDANRSQIQHVYEWQKKALATTGKLSLRDYDFENPKADLEVSKSMAKGNHGHNELEIYDYPGHYTKAQDGTRLARIRMEAEAIRHKTVKAVGNVSTISVGQVFELAEHSRKEENGEYIISRAVHQFNLTEGPNPPLGLENPTDENLTWEDAGTDPYRVIFEAVPKEAQTPYRAPLVTEWPEISGVHTALVVGPSGEEIYTDEHGRIKVQFHWDRIGGKDQNSSLWVRCMMPWTGKGWGMIHIPRIGQEVVVQFEEGDPDRPLVVGMLYNADTMPPYELPGKMTQSGFTTRSTKSGNTDTFHELMFEDKKDEELVRFQSERDYKQIIKNNAEITIGLEHTDKGDLEQTIYRHKTETLKTGDKTCTVETGNEIRDIATDQTETIGGKRTIQIGGNDSQTIGGDQAATIGGKQEVSVGSDMKETIGSSQTTKAGQSITIEAGVKIELKVGGSKLTLDPSGVKIEGPMITIDAKGMLTAKAGGVGQVQANGPLILKGMPILAN